MRFNFCKCNVFPPDYPNLARKSSTVISAVIALPEGEKLKLPDAASCASSAAASSRDMRRAVASRPARHHGGDLLAPHIGQRHGVAEGLQQVVKQRSTESAGMSAGVPSPRRRSRRRKSRSKPRQRTRRHSLRAGRIRCPKAPAVRETAAADSPTNRCRASQVILVKNPLAGAAHVDHYEASAQQSGDIAARSGSASVNSGRAACRDAAARNAPTKG